jgi:DNA-binding response OmpR family regulator
MRGDNWEDETMPRGEERRMRILIIEDDARLAELIAKVLRQEHFDAEIALDGTTGLDLALTGSFDALIVDRMLPGLDGLGLVRAMREARVDTPALMLTALGELGERVEGLQAGADDYLGKPFAFDELLARLQAILRRRDRPIVEHLLGASGLRLHQDDETVSLGDRTVSLTHREYVLLETLVRHAGQTVSRDTLLEKVWGYDTDPAGNVVELYVHYVRRKLAELGPEGTNPIRTIRGVGYRIERG